MGLRFRKSVRIGKYFRINISKSGIGYSFGVPGARITHSANGRVTTTVGIPGTGISYSTSHNSNSNRSNNRTVNPVPQNQGIEAAVSTEHANINDFQPAEMSDLLKTMRIAKNTNTFGIVLLIVGFILLTGFSSTNIAFMYFGVIGLILGIVLMILARTTLPAQIEYEMEDQFKEIHAERVEAWKKFFSSKSKWQTTTMAQVTNRKINAGASASVNRVAISLTQKAPFYIKTDVKVVRLNLKSEKILILPDKLIIIKGFKFGAIDYKDVRISTYTGRFIENGLVPRDAQIIDHTWQYVNRNGSPDKRFNNNRRLPVCSYGYVSITSTSGLDITISCSNDQNIDKLKNLSSKRYYLFNNTEPSAYVCSEDVLKIIFNGNIPTFYTELMVKSAVRKYGINATRIINDCINIIYTTNNVETFFSRYHILVDTLNACSKIAIESSSFTCLLPDTSHLDLKNKKDNLINNVIARSYAEELNKCNQLKTVNGRNNRLKKYFNLLNKFDPEMSTQNRDYIKSLSYYNNFMQETQTNVQVESVNSNISPTSSVSQEKNLAQQAIEIIKEKYPDTECSYTQQNGIYSIIIQNYGRLRISNHKQVKCDYLRSDGSTVFFGDINKLQTLNLE